MKAEPRACNQVLGMLRGIPGDVGTGRAWREQRLEGAPPWGGAHRGLGSTAGWGCLASAPSVPTGLREPVQVPEHHCRRHPRVLPGVLPRAEGERRGLHPRSVQHHPGQGTGAATSQPCSKGVRAAHVPRSLCTLLCVLLEMLLLPAQLCQSRHGWHWPAGIRPRLGHVPAQPDFFPFKPSPRSALGCCFMGCL